MSTFDQYIGLEYEDTDEGCVASIEIKPHHCNPTGNINGGVLISLADNIATGAAGDGRVLRDREPVATAVVSGRVLHAAGDRRLRRCGSVDAANVH